MLTNVSGNVMAVIPALLNERSQSSRTVSPLIIDGIVTIGPHSVL